MTDVGRVAGVSHQTVSRVLNGSSRVDPTTRARVLSAIEQLGYRRNVAARALVTGRTQTLGVVGFDITLFGPASVLAGIERAARAAATSSASRTCRAWTATPSATRSTG
jgi:DNA-binding LacI/PurR family transcriptional regulator